MKYFFLLLAIVFLNSNCSAQNREANQALLFEVEYTNHKYVGCYSKAYSLLNIKEIEDFELIDNDSVDSPRITYNLTANGGLYISQAFTDIYTLGCCEYADVNKGIAKYVDGEIPKDSLVQYSEINDQYPKINELSLKVLHKECKGFSYSKRKGAAIYDVTVWLAYIDYCVCNIYVETPKQKIYGNKAAYIIEIENITKPDDKTQKMIVELLNKMIALDVN